MHIPYPIGNSAINSLLSTTFTTKYLSIFHAIEMVKLLSHLAFLFFVLSIFSDSSALHKQKGDSSFTVKLYTRESLGLSPFQNNRESTLAKLKSDAARVDWISRRLNPLNQSNVAVPVISGHRQVSYQYFARFGIGTPAKQFYITVDTGSEVTWIQCANCDLDCFSQTDPLFDPKKSSSYKPASCHDTPCFLDCFLNKCMYNVKYEDNSSSYGERARETFTLGNSVYNDVIFGCGTENLGNFVGSAGVWGLGIGSVSFPYQINAKSFSYCLVDRLSPSSSILSFGSSIPSDALTTPFTNKLKPYYALSLTAITVGLKVFSISHQENTFETPLAVDSGTFVTFLPTRTYNAIRDEFVNCINLPLVERPSSFLPPIDTCFKRTFGARFSVPPVKFHFGRKILELPRKNCLLPDPGNPDVVCFPFAPTDETLGVLGSFQQQGFQVTVDLINSLVGFSANKC